MKAIILAAGFANRMRPLTDRQHKTLLKIGSRTVIERIIDGLLDNGIRSIVVGLGYRAQELCDFLTGHYGPRCDFTFITNERFRETNNIYSLALIFENWEVDDDVLLIESDLVYEPAVIERAIRSPHANVALVDRYRSGMDGTVVSLDGDVVTSVIPPHMQGRNFDFSDKYKTLNIYKFSREFCQRDFRRILSYYARNFDDNCYYELMLGVLIYMKREGIFAERVDGLKWAEIDDPNDLRLAEYQFDTGKRREMLDRAWGGFWGYPVRDFAFIRNMHFPPASVFSEVRNNLHELLTQYGSTQAILEEKLAYLTLRAREHLVLLNGASQVFPILRDYFGGSSVLIPQPGFGEYGRIFPAARHYLDDGIHHLAQLESALAQPGHEVVVIVNPNNPTGSLIPTRVIADLIRAHPSRFFLVDESFIDFSGEPSLEEVADAQADNFLVLKSLSKVLGVPGVRLGYAFTRHQKLRRFIEDGLPIWNSNSVAEFLLEVLLKHRNAFAQAVRQTVSDREAFAAELRALRCVDRVFDSAANFLLVRMACTAEQAEAAARSLLDRHGIYVKSIASKFNDGAGYYRFAVRLPLENSALVLALDEVFGEARALSG